MADRWYCSDHHLGHWNIIEYGKRPFTSLAEMHDALLTYHNERVKLNDHVSFLGDVTIKRGGRLDREWFVTELKRYHGHKRLYLGNHDHLPIPTYLEVFEKIYATWRNEERFVCSHIPLHPQSLTNVIANVHGHIHQNPVFAPARIEKHSFDKIENRIVPYINVSMEAIHYTPIHLDEILALIAQYNTAT